jgi:lipopolysaccharide/colanic/teichoic acid biosynthesis glycosyltransferase
MAAFANPLTERDMRTVDANPSHVVPIEDIVASGPGVAPASVPQAAPSASLVSNAGKTDDHKSHVWEDVRESSAETADARAEEIPLWKRILDVTCILLSMAFWLPLVILVALWVKIVSPGPIFFRQERVGYRGSRFLLFKFRTMKVNVETHSHEKHLEQLIDGNAPMTKLDSGDPRIIAGGRILRALGLDESPQLFNVLRGEMSLVGPRPCTPHEFKRYKDWQRERVNALPGLTGYWQVNGKNKTTFTEMVHMDIWYTRNLSPWLDVVIIFKTIPALIVQFVETRVLTRVGSGAHKAAAEQG